MIAAIMCAMGFHKEVEKVLTGWCPFCNVKVTVADLRDDLSVREFHISGLCQKCQDDIFGKEAP